MSAHGDHNSGSAASHRRLWKDHKTAAGLVGCCLLVHAVLAFQVACYNCVTHDEFWHIPAGVWNLKTGRFHYDNLNPPMPRVLAAIPLVLSGVSTGDVAEDADKETRADEFVVANGDRYHRYIVLARTTTIALSLITAVVMASWAFELFGPGAAVLSSFLWCMTPDILAHGSLVTSDAPAALSMLLMFRSVWKHALAPNMRPALWMGLAFGTAQLVKFTCIVGIPLACGVWCLFRFRNAQAAPAKGKTIAGQWLFAAVICLLTINLGYLLQGTLRPLNSFQFQSQAMQSLRDSFPLPNFRVPLPADFVEGIDHQRSIMEQQHPIYLDGLWSFSGFPDYYIKTWWYKTPHQIQLLCVLTLIGLMFSSQRSRELPLQICLLLPVFLLGFIASRTSMQLGNRYLLPAFPFLFLFASQMASFGRRPFGGPQILAAVLAISMLWTAVLKNHPLHLSYFNELAGGPEQGRFHLIDSNIDWGQDLLALKEFVDRNQITDLKLAYFGMIVPTRVGLKFTVPVAETLQPGWHAISVTFVQGKPHTIREPDGGYHSVDFNAFGWARMFRPKQAIGHSILLYDLSAADAARVRSAAPAAREHQSQ
ncbi:MAG: hypothetical protein R3C49_16505 [Planctomycetaceae bacterium]